jgi:hypothetical protein
MVLFASPYASAWCCIGFENLKVAQLCGWPAFHGHGQIFAVVG